jgi:hypothetical protein
MIEARKMAIKLPTTIAEYIRMAEIVAETGSEFAGEALVRCRLDNGLNRTATVR